MLQHASPLIHGEHESTKAVLVDFQHKLVVDVIKSNGEDVERWIVVIMIIVFNALQWFLIKNHSLKVSFMDALHKLNIFYLKVLSMIILLKQSFINSWSRIQSIKSSYSNVYSHYFTLEHGDKSLFSKRNREENKWSEIESI